MDVVRVCDQVDAATLRTLFERHRDRVYSIALRYSGDPAEAMDIAQETFLKLIAAIDGFRGESSYETWIYRMVVNACLDRRRRSWRLMPLVEEITSLLRCPQPDAAEQLLKREMDEEIRVAVAALPPDLRMVVVLRYTEGLSYDRIAELTGCAEGTVASRLNRAHRLLGRRLRHLERTAHA